MRRVLCSTFKLLTRCSSGLVVQMLLMAGGPQSLVHTDWLENETTTSQSHGKYRHSTLLKSTSSSSILDKHKAFLVNGGFLPILFSLRFSPLSCIESLASAVSRSKFFHSCVLLPEIHSCGTRYLLRMLSLKEHLPATAQAKLFDDHSTGLEDHGVHVDTFRDYSFSS